MREQEAASVTEVRIVGLELVPVVAQRQRLLERARDRHEAPEMVHPFLVVQSIEPH